VSSVSDLSLGALSSECRHCRRSPASSSAARSPITTHRAMVLAVVIRGMMEPSAMRRP
jgi:hypothetical protein